MGLVFKTLKSINKTIKNYVRNRVRDSSFCGKTCYLVMKDCSRIPRKIHKSIKYGRKPFWGYCFCLFMGILISLFVFFVVYYITINNSADPQIRFFPWTVVFSSFTAPLLLLLWYWRHINKHSDIVNTRSQIELTQTQFEYTQSQTELSLWVNICEQLGSTEAMVRIGGMELLRRNIDISINKKQWHNVAYGIRLLCGYIRKQCSTNELKSTKRFKETHKKPLYPVDYIHAVKCFIDIYHNNRELFMDATGYYDDSSELFERGKNEILKNIIDLSGTYLECFDFDWLPLNYSDFSNAILDGSSFVNASFIWSKLKKASFYLTNLSRTWLFYADADNCNFQKVYSYGSLWFSVDFGTSDFSGLIFWHVGFDRDMHNCDLTKVKGLSQEQLNQIVWKNKEYKVDLPEIGGLVEPSFWGQDVEVQEINMPGKCPDRSHITELNINDHF